MRTLKRYVHLPVMAMGIILFAATCYAGGLRTAFSKVEVKNLIPGVTYSTEETIGLPLEVKNTSDYEVELKVDILMPEEDELKDGFMPIPDLGWISLDEDHFFIEAGGTGKTDVHIDIPDDAGHFGKKYAVFIWSHTVGRSIGMGLKSKLFFTMVDRETYERTNEEE